MNPKQLLLVFSHVGGHNGPAG